MNSKIKISAILLGIVLLYSCEGFLDEPIRGAQVLDTYFDNEQECEKFVVGCYETILQGDVYWYVKWFYVLTESGTDDSWLGMPLEAEQDFKEFSTLTVNSHNTWLYPIWEYMYKSIYQCNMALENLPESPVNGSNPELITRLVGEAKFIRAYAYFELVKNFETMPLFDHVLSPTELNNVTFTDQQQIYDQIIRDLQDAVDVLPDNYDTDNKGRATKWAASAYLAKAYMYSENWEKAYEYANDLIVSGPFSLEPRFGEIWDINNRNGVESIFEFQTNYDPNYTTGNAFPILTGARKDNGGWYYTQPTSNLEKEYLALNDTIRLRATIIKGINEATINQDIVGKAPVYDTDGTTVALPELRIATLEESKSMRVNRKFFILPDDRLPTYSSQLMNHIPKNQILLRLAEVKFIRAEAMWRMINTVGGAAFSESDIINGDLHDIRDRVGLPDINSSGNQLLLDIYKERRLELAMEFKRWDEMRRTKHPDDGRRMIYHIMGPQGSFVLYNMEQNNDYWEKGSPYAEFEPSDKGIDFVTGAEWLPIPAR
ncbi:MAG TPA: RagB/SusD family nutrient uptake outer membrane protein, partial [Bacteroides sp.]|nr:RagB/SusD family nutrient uptake outer membrane protein [Bacteroides sp.]